MGNDPHESFNRSMQFAKPNLRKKPGRMEYQRGEY